ncbi:MAG: cbb3-type cytochrome c oxidase subunit 3 [Gemmatimonadales bacterium]|nr:cbb3-type cytochrome c oxidase subunit 3 [Gemmatimonadales bacterium]
MKLSDIMGHAQLSGYAVVAMLIFLAVFVAVVWRIFHPAQAERWAQDARMPLDDERPTLPRQP